MSEIDEATRNKTFESDRQKAYRFAFSFIFIFCCAILFAQAFDGELAGAAGADSDRLYNYNQSSRTEFSNGAELVEYVCQGEAATFVPVCYFPNANRHWISDMDQVEVGNCDITFGEALGSSYDLKCAIYFAASFIPVVMTFGLIKAARENKIAGKSRTKGLNMGEKICFMNLFIR